MSKTRYANSVTSFFTILIVVLVVCQPVVAGSQYGIDEHQSDTGNPDNLELTSTSTSTLSTADEYFLVSIVNTSSRVVEGHTFNITVNVTNSGASAGSQTLELVAGGSILDAASVSLGPGNSTTVNLSWSTRVGEAGSWMVTVRSSNDSATTTVRMDRVSTLSFEAGRDGDAVPPDPWYLTDTDGHHRVSTNHSTNGNLSMHLSGASSLGKTRVHVDVNLTQVSKIKADIYLVSGDPSWGDVKIDIDNKSHNILGVTGKTEGQWYRNVTGDVSGFTGHHELILRTRGPDNEAYFDNIRVIRSGVVNKSDPTAYDSIQNAIDNANEGATIDVHEGTYHENLTLDKNVTLTGIGTPQLNGSSTSGAAAITIPTDSPAQPVVRGFEIRNYSTGMKASETRGAWTLANVSISDTDTAVNAFAARGDWVIRSNTIADNGDAVFANGTTGDWRITQTSILTNEVGVFAGTTTGSWRISESVIQGNGHLGISAALASPAGNASYNYWGMTDGPSGDFSGSGDAIAGNVTARPYYTDGNLTELSPIDQSDEFGEGFEDGRFNDTWTIENNQSDAHADVVSTRTRSGNKSLKIHVGRSGSGDYAVVHNLSENISENASFSFWWYSDSPDTNLHVGFRNWSSSASISLNVGGKNRNIGYRSDQLSSRKDLATKYTGEWYKATVVVHPDTDTADLIVENASGGRVTATRITTTVEFDHLRISATDYWGNYDVYIDDTSFNRTNKPPEAEFTVTPESPNVGAAVELNALNSTDHDGSITAYEWDLNNDGGPEERGEVVTTNFSSTGEHMIALTVTDDFGSANTVTQNVTVQEAPTENRSWWDTAWQHRRTLNITERSGRDLTHYPVVTPPLEIGNASVDSIRVVNETSMTVVPFAVNNTSAGVQVAFKINASASTSSDSFAIYYGNQNASSVAIDWWTARYNFYDGFDDGVIHGKWAVMKGSWAESAGTLKSQSSAGNRITRPFVAPLNQTALPIRWEVRLVSRTTGAGTDQRQAYLWNESRDGHRILYVRTYENSDDGVGVNIGFDSPDSQKLLTADEFSVNNWVVQEATLLPNGSIRATARNEANGISGSKTYHYSTTYRYHNVSVNDYGGSPGAEYDYIKLRYDVDPEPAFEVGVEETATVARAIIVNQSDPNTHGSIQAAVDNASHGQTIVVHSGIYQEHVEIKKGVRIVSRSIHEGGELSSTGAPSTAPVLDGNGTIETAVNIQSNVSGFEMVGIEFRNYTYGVRAWNNGTEGVTIRHNSFERVESALLVGGDPTIADIGTGRHDRWTIESNAVHNPRFIGIELHNLLNSTVKGNEIHRSRGTPNASGFSYGLTLSSINETVADVQVTNNTVSGSYDNVGIFIFAGFPPYDVPGRLTDVRVGDNHIHGSLGGDGIAVAAWRQGQSDNVTVVNNTVDNATTIYPGIGVFAVNGSQVNAVTVKENSLTGNEHGFGANVSADGSLADIQVVDNRLASNHQHGIIVASNVSGAALNIHDNRIFNNNASGLQHNGTGQVNATYNWWGASDGPAGEASGSGDAVVGNVTVEPWFVDSALATLGVVVPRATSTYLALDNRFEDLSGHGRSVVNHGAERGPGITGSAAVLNRSEDDYLTAESNLTGQPFTYAAWFKIDTYGRYGGAVFTNYGDRRRLYVNGTGNLCSRMWGGNGPNEGDPVCGGRVPLDTWTHVAFVFNGSMGTLYLNGSVVARQRWDGYTGSSKTCIGSVGAGADCEARTGRFDGYVDEWYIISRPLNGSQIRSLRFETAASLEPPRPSFTRDVYVEQRGDFAEIEVTVPDDSHPTIWIGSRAAAFNVSATVADGNDDGQVTLYLDTFHTDASSPSSFLGTKNASDSLVSTAMYSFQLSSPIDAYEYNLTLTDNGTVLDSTTFGLEERSNDGITTHVAPGSAIAVDAARQSIPSKEVARGDKLVVKVEASGLYAYLAGSLDGTNAGLSLRFEELNPGVNRDPRVFYGDVTTVISDPENDTFWAVLDTEDQFLQPGEAYAVEFRIAAENNPLVAGTSPGDDEVVSTKFNVVKRTATFDQAPIFIRPAPDQRISGSTTLAPGTSLTLVLNNSATGAVIANRTTTVKPEGRWSVFLNGSSLADSTNVTAKLFEVDVSTNGTVSNDSAVTFASQTADGPTVRIDAAYLHDAGFVAVHEGSASGPIIGVSGFLPAGMHHDIEVPLDSTPEAPLTVTSVAHRDTNDNATFDFPGEDGPYLDDAAQPIAETATVYPESVVRVGHASVSRGGTAGVPITVSTLPTGLAGYNITVTIDNGSVASVQRATYPDSINLTQTTIAPDGNMVRLKAVDIANRTGPGEENVTLATVRMQGDSLGETNLSVTVNQLDDDGAQAVHTTIRSGSILVSGCGSVLPGLSTPSDPDGDGLFEDVNGNNRFDFNDIVAFFKHLSNAEVACHDFNGNGRIDFDDIVKLFKEI